MKGKKRFTLLLDYSNSRNSRLINTTSESKRSNSTVAQSILVQPLSTRRNNEILSKILQPQYLNESYYNGIKYKDNEATTQRNANTIEVPQIKLHKIINSEINTNKNSTLSTKRHYNVNTNINATITTSTLSNDYYRNNNHIGYNKPSFCLINKTKHFKSKTCLRKDKRVKTAYNNNNTFYKINEHYLNNNINKTEDNNNNNTTNINDANHNGFHFDDIEIGKFTNQTLSSLFKIDRTIFKLSTKIQEEVKDGLITGDMKRKMRINERNIIKEKERSSSKDIIIHKLKQVLNNSNNYGVIDQFGTRKLVNYITKMQNELRKDIRKKELYVKDTMDSLKRLQRNNDENLNKVSFIMSVRKK